MNCKIILPTTYVRVSWITSDPKSQYPVRVKDINAKNLSGASDKDALMSYIKSFCDDNIVDILNWNVYSVIENNENNTIKIDLV